MADVSQGPATLAALDALDGADSLARREALTALAAGGVAFDDALVASLLRLLAEPARDVQRRAAGALVVAAAEPCYREALRAALGDNDPSRRWGVAFALARAGERDEAILDAALEALGRPDGDVRWAAAEIVCSIVGSQRTLERAVVVAARAANADQRKMALYCLRDLGGQDPNIYCESLGDGDRDVRLAALSGLARCSGAGEPELIRVIDCMEHDEDAGVRRSAAATLGRMPSSSPSAAAALVRARDRSDDRDLVRAATDALERIEARRSPS